MKTGFTTFIYFLGFFRIALINANAYLILPLSFFSVFLLSYSKVRRKLYRSFGSTIVLIFFISFLFFLISDTFGHGAKSPSTLLSVRVIALFLLSVLPNIIIYYLLSGDFDRLKKVILFVIIVQSIFWWITYISPSFKVLVYSLIGSEDNVNLRDYNMSARGFGVSKELNYTTPFVMVLICFTLFKNYFFKLFIFFMQLFNSNNVLISFVIGSMSTRKTAAFFLVLAIFSFLGMWYFWSYIETVSLFPRLIDELQSGGVRTISALYERHVHFLNSSWFEYLFGTSYYIFDGNYSVYSDIGWIIIFNHSGLVGVTLTISLLLALSTKAFGVNILGAIWFFAGVWLNAKGLIIGPNGYVFFLSSMALFRERSN